MTLEFERWQRIHKLFDAARELSIEQREAFLHEACADPELRGEVDTLLRAHEALEAGAGNNFLGSLEPARASVLLGSGDEIDDVVDPERLAAGEFVGRYRIVHRLGRGGMGVVYLAHDPRLNRAVALKLLPTHLSQDESARRRFEEEARAASALDHPHIATVYEIGEAAGGHVFIAMAYCEGETLRERLERGPMPVADAVLLATRIADGLSASHERGIIHRDVKPGNVLLTSDGGAKIVDFGVAKITGSVLTKTGATLGTVAYMSPEQTRGEAAEPTTDVWSLGVTLFEMLAGSRPFINDNEQALVYAIRNDQQVPIRKLRPDVPSEVAAVVERCLCKKPADRYQNASALLADLRESKAIPATTHAGAFGRRAPEHHRSVTGLLVLLLLFAGALALLPRLKGTDAAPEPPPDSSTLVSHRLAVLPLSNYSVAPEDAYFADGLTEELISSLSMLPGLRVIARTSVMPYKDGDKGIAEVGRELNVGVVLEGSVRRAGNDVRITARLIDVRSQQHLWAEEYETDMATVLDVLGQIAERVAHHLNVQWRAGDWRQIEARGTDNPDAYASYLKGRYFLGKLDESSFRQSRDYFLQALDLDPTFAHAWSGLADAYEHLSSLSALHAYDAYPRARAAAERALELDPGLADAHASLAMVFSMYYWNSEAAGRHFRRAIELDPSYARARRMYASHLRNLGRFDEALVEVRKAQELDPLSAFPRLEEAIILYVARRYDAAIAHCRRLLGTAPGATHAYLLLALAYTQKEQYEEALASVLEGDPQSDQPDALGIRGHIYAAMGRRDEAQRMLHALDELATDQPVSAFHKVAIYMGLGEHDRAIDVLEQAADERTGLIRLLNVEPMFDPLRAQPRFRALLRRVGLA